MALTNDPRHAALHQADDVDQAGLVHLQLRERDAVLAAVPPRSGHRAQVSFDAIRRTERRGS